MDLRRLRAGEWIAALGGAVLAVSLFVPWYPELTGWEALAVNDVLLALFAALAVAVLVVTATQAVPAVPMSVAGLSALAGLIAVVVVLVRVVWLPDGADARETGVWLALAGAFGIAVGSALAMRDERLSKPGRWTDLSGRPSPPPAEIEPIRPPAP
jgi:hypothetical protein